MVKIPLEKTKIEELYPDNTAECTLWLYPYINFIDSEKKLLIPFMQKGSPDEGRWLKDIVKYTPRPGFIHSIADAFMEKEGFQKKTFLSIHWNFDKDYEDACSKNQGEIFCNLKTNATGAYKALIKHVKAHNQKQKLNAIYFSASSKVLNEISADLEKAWNEEFDGLIKILTRDDLQPVVEEHGCIGVPTDDAIETAEMEICYRASTFIRAQYSIWSRTIDYERRATHQRTLSDKLFTEVIKMYEK